MTSANCAHADLWERVEAHLRARGPDAVLFTKVKGHAKAGIKVGWLIRRLRAKSQHR